MARFFGISESAITFMKQGCIWAHVNREELL